jgi:hypothetical protein
VALGEVLREFGVKVSLAFDGKKVDEAEKRMKDFGSEMRSFALEVAGVTAGLFATGKSFTSFGRSIENQAGALNITTDELQEYEYAAGVAADANREDLVASFQNLGDTMDKARAGVPEARQALFNMANAAGRGGELIAKLHDPMFKVTDAAKLLSDGINKMSLSNPMAARRMTELAFGSDKLYNLWRQGPAAIDALNKEADKNSVINKKMIDQGYKLDQQLTKIWFIFRKFGLEIGSNVMRHLMPMINQFMRWFGANQKLISSGINGFLDALAEGLKAVFETTVAVARALGPVIDLLGGTGNAVKLLISAFVAWKALGIASSFISMLSGIAGLLPSISTLVGVFSGLGEAFKSLSLIEGVADILPAIELFGTGALAALAPLLPVMAAIAGAGVAIHDIMTLLSGGSFKDTWTGKGWDKVKEGVGWVSDKVKGIGNMSVGGAMPYTQVAAAGAGAGGGSTSVTQENHFTTQNNITVPSGTSAPAASAMISKANVDSHEELMRKAKMDAARSRQY